MGGSKLKPTVSDGVTACVLCNDSFEAHLQERALLNGWKVRGWAADRFGAGAVPVRYPLLGGWHLLRLDGGREWISTAAARALMTDIYPDEYERWEQAA